MHYQFSPLIYVAKFFVSLLLLCGLKESTPLTGHNTALDIVSRQLAAADDSRWLPQRTSSLYAHPGPCSHGVSAVKTLNNSIRYLALKGAVAHLGRAVDY
ncbi:hypothetical protein PoB_000543800 [Plakobranchus ocellatus]|uniref:Secreted protein n=1 Tax=Plakobranchus ocellatus TaxID=259542 RepID=A0AAV3Y8U7_9GAST|nr:hypothetical protein PoB_000543800 [Plakobranchus ocellatus]